MYRWCVAPGNLLLANAIAHLLLLAWAVVTPNLASTQPLIACKCQCLTFVCRGHAWTGGEIVPPFRGVSSGLVSFPVHKRQNCVAFISDMPAMLAWHPFGWPIPCSA